jgi:hypothetical protein
MKCSIDECPGSYERREVVHTVRHTERLLNSRPIPTRSVPLYEYA